MNLFNQMNVHKKLDKLRIPYKGSKNQIARKLFAKMLEIKPDAEYFVDLFGGGGSMSFFALQCGLKVIYNEKQTDLVNFLKFIVDRVNNNQKSKYGIFPEEFYRFVSKEEFFEQKKLNTPFAEFCRIAYSFGNNQKSYAFSKDKEVSKKLLHNVVLFKCEISLKEINDLHNITLTTPYQDTWNERRLDVVRQVHNLIKDNNSFEDLERLEQLERLQCLERLQQLEQLQGLERFTILNKNYADVLIDTSVDKTIVYLDPPYRNTDKYREGKDLNYKELDEWFMNNKYDCFMSEYNTPFYSVLEINKRELFSKNKNLMIEKLYYNKA